MKHLIVDSSALMRRYLSEMMSGIVAIEVLTARDSIDVLAHIKQQNLIMGKIVNLCNQHRMIKVLEPENNLADIDLEIFGEEDYEAFNR